MDPREIVPAKLTMSQIRDIAETFRNDYIFNDSIPVDIERIIESTMGITIIPVKSLQHDCDMEGFISRDFKSIYLDEDLYMDNRYYKRVRFTIAHEIGHLVLHRSNIDMVRFLSDDDWKGFRLNLQDDPLRWFETQASEFAGRLLVPIEKLINAFKEARIEIIKKNTSWDAPKIDDEEMLYLIASSISPKFDVSAEVIEKRLRKENAMSLIGK
jgi:Zn-dependent peptidase ImmA (M78 family)